MPIVIYGNGDNVMGYVQESDLRDLLITPKVHLVELELEGKVHQVKIKEVQYHPVNDRPLHIDFYRYDSARPLEMAIPVVLEGHAVGVKAGGKLLSGVRKIRVKGLPANLPNVLTVDVSEMEVGAVKLVKDLQFENLEVTETKTLVVATIKAQRASKDAAAAADAGKK